MPVERGIHSTGDLRRYIADCIVAVRKGELDVDRASQIQKMAGQITESMYVELKAVALSKLSPEIAESFGGLLINEPVAMQIGDGKPSKAA